MYFERQLSHTTYTNGRRLRCSIERKILRRFDDEDRIVEVRILRSQPAHFGRFVRGILVKKTTETFITFNPLGFQRNK